MPHAQTHPKHILSEPAENHTCDRRINLLSYLREALKPEETALIYANTNTKHRAV